MKLRENPQALAVFNKILAALQRLDSLEGKINDRDEYRHSVSQISKDLQHAGMLLDIFVEGITETEKENPQKEAGRD